MQSALAISASGLRHATLRQATAAHDTANLGATDTVGLRVEGRQAPAKGGVVTTVSGRLERRPATAPVPRAIDAVELSVRAGAAVHAVGANAAAVRTTDDMLGSLLDAIA